jgi:hypothetical protein
MDIASPPIPSDFAPERRPFHLSWDGHELAVHGELTRPDQLDALIEALRVERGHLEATS